MSEPNNLDLMQGHPDFVVDQGVGPVIRWHGATIDLRNVTEGQALAMAREKQTRYVQFSPARAAKEADVMAPKPAPAKTALPQGDTINIFEGHPDYEVTKGVGPVLAWRNTTVNLKKLPLAQAEAMANDPETRFVTHSAARKAADLNVAILENIVRASANNDAPSDPGTDPASATETGRRRRRAS